MVDGHMLHVLMRCAMMKFALNTFSSSFPSLSSVVPEVWEAEENEKAKKKRQEELRVQYLKEQEVQNSKYVHFDVCHVTVSHDVKYALRELLGRAHPLSFMYEPPPGFKKEERKVRV